jgi:hypothetical protein
MKCAQLLISTSNEAAALCDGHVGKLSRTYRTRPAEGSEVNVITGSAETMECYRREIFYCVTNNECKYKSMEEIKYAIDGEVYSGISKNRTRAQSKTTSPTHQSTTTREWRAPVKSLSRKIQRSHS